MLYQLSYTPKPAGALVKPRPPANAERAAPKVRRERPRPERGDVPGGAHTRNVDCALRP
jgi:hypothetical protein